MGTLVRRRKTWRHSARKVMEFGQLMIDILVYVFCKFEMYVFKIAQVISENVHIAFLYVLSIVRICNEFCLFMRLFPHYANMSVQYTSIFHGYKNNYFQLKNIDIFLIFAQNKDCGYTFEPPQ